MDKQKKTKTKKAKKPAGKRKLLIVVVVILAIILAALIAVTLFVDNMLGRVNRVEEDDTTLSHEQIEQILNNTEPEDEDYTGETMDAEDVDLPDVPVGLVGNGENVINILLVGQDNYSVDQRSRTDSMILCTINVPAKTLTMTSFMRDMYVRIPGYMSQRLNVAYPLGGFETLYETLEFNFGIEVDHGVAVNFASFQEVIDAVGGVDVELTGSEANHLNGQNYQWGLSEGINHLTGEQALAFARIRKLDSDFKRTSRQRTVMMALVEEAKDMSLTELYNLVNAMIPMVITDMSDAEIVGTAMELAPLLADLSVVTQRIPADDAYYMTMIDGMSVLVPDLEENRQLLISTIGDPESAE